MLKGYEKLKENAFRTKQALYELHLCNEHVLPYLIREEKFLKTSD